MNGPGRRTKQRPVAARHGRAWRRMFLAGGCSLFVGVAGCSTGTGPREPALRPTLLVENPMCVGQDCATLGVAMYVRSWLDHVSDSSLAGVWLGYVEGPETCFALPTADTLTVPRPDSAGVATDSARYSWSPDDPNGVFLGVFMRLTSAAVSREFVPARSQGWLMRMPDSVPYGAVVRVPLRAAAPCTPGS